MGPNRRNQSVGHVGGLMNRREDGTFQMITWVNKYLAPVVRTRGYAGAVRTGPNQSIRIIIIIIML